MNKITMWIDVSAKSLNIYCKDLSISLQISNDLFSIKQFFSSLDISNLLVLYEATGIYSNKIAKYCNDLNISHYQIHPSQLSLIAKWLGKKNKTDILDAKSITIVWELMLQHMWEIPLPSTNQMKQLQSYLSDINSLKELENKYANLIHKNHEDVFWDEQVKKFYSNHFEEIESKINEIILKLEELLIQAGYKSRLEHLITIPWIWKESSIYLLIFFIDLSNRWIKDKKKVVSFAWLNPIEEQSWTSLNRSKISKRWNSWIRDILYMPMMNRYKMINKEEYAKTNMWQFFLRMKTKFESPTNKRWKSVIVAMMKKTLLVAWWIYQTDTSYNWL